MPTNQQFEIPEELRQLAEDNVERARKLYLQYMQGMSEAMQLWSESPSGKTSAAFDEARERAIQITRENADAAFKLAKDVANAKDLQELVTLQTRYVQSQMKLYAQQTQQFGQLMAHAFGGSEQSQPGGQAGRSGDPS